MNDCEGSPPMDPGNGPLRDWIAEIDPEAVLFDGLDDAIVGLTTAFEPGGHRTRVVYDMERCIEALMEQGCGDYESAQEYLEFNVLGAYVGEQTPAFLVKAPVELRHPAVACRTPSPVRARPRAKRT